MILTFEQVLQMMADVGFREDHNEPLIHKDELEALLNTTHELYKERRAKEPYRRWVPGMAAVLVLVSLCLSGCVSNRGTVYGYGGPASQSDVYHPFDDPLFR